METLGFVATPARLAWELAALPPEGPLLDPAAGKGDLLLAAWRRGGRTAETARRLHGIEIHPELARRARAKLREAIPGREGRAAARRLRCRDALAAGTRWTPRSAVLANPPWASFSGRRRVYLPAELAPSRGAEGRAAGGWPSLHGAFLKRIARHVAEGGALARVLVPASVEDREGYRALRREVSEQCSVRVVRRVEQGEFEGVVEAGVLLELTPGRGSWSGEASEPAAIVRDLIDAPRLDPSCFADIGVHTGNSAALLVHRTTSQGDHPLREGRDLSAFRLGPPKARLHVPRVRPKDARYRIPELRRHQEVPILLRQTASRPIAARHRAPCHFRNTLLACTPPPGLAPEFVLGVLNSELIANWHRASFADARQPAFPQVKVSHLRALPFPLRTRTDGHRIHDEIAALARDMEERPSEVLAGALEAAVRRAFDLEA